MWCRNDINVRTQPYRPPLAFWLSWITPMEPLCWGRARSQNDGYCLLQRSAAVSNPQCDGQIITLTKRKFNTFL